ncbi:MAG: hypothetical protein ACM3NF_07810 [Gemmatimonadota bacterium]
MRDRRPVVAVAAGAVLLAVLSGSGCGPRVAAVYEKVLGSPSYEGTTEALTRTKEVHDGLDTRFIVSATWLSPRWVEAFTEEYARIYYLDAARKERVGAYWKGESEKYVRFFVALFTPDERLNDLDKRGTTWSLRLVGPGEKDYAPVYLKATDLRPEEVARFFPDVGTWSRAYEVAFPKEAGEGAAAEKAGAPRFKLVLSGVQGRAVLAWE